MSVCSLIPKTLQPKLESNDVLVSAHRKIEKLPIDCHSPSDNRWAYSPWSRVGKFTKTVCLCTWVCVSDKE